MKKQFTVTTCSDGFRIKDTTKTIVPGTLVKLQFYVEGNWTVMTVPFEPEAYMPFIRSKYTMFVYTGNKPETVMISLASAATKPVKEFRSTTRWYNTQPVTIYPNGAESFDDIMLNSAPFYSFFGWTNPALLEQPTESDFDKLYNEKPITHQATEFEAPTQVRQMEESLPLENEAQVQESPVLFENPDNNTSSVSEPNAY